LFVWGGVLLLEIGGERGKRSLGGGERGKGWREIFLVY